MLSTFSVNLSALELTSLTDLLRNFVAKQPKIKITTAGIQPDKAIFGSNKLDNPTALFGQT